ncbi:MAG TPA: hypothetical protein VLJ80_09130 [Solirubrobacteraceae bacterium]|nr:hypothetical protein [Solirubrobacteraceae bacterium]
MSGIRLIIALLAVLAMSATIAATSASASLPEAELLPGESFPVESTSTIKGTEVAFIESSLGLLIICNELKELLTLETAHLGKFDDHWVGCKDNGVNVNTIGDAAGVMLFKGTEHLVFVLLSPLAVGTVRQLEEATLEIGKAKVKVKGVVVAGLSPLNEETTKYKLNLKCSGKGKQELSSYFNEAGESLTKQLPLINAGLGNENACYAAKEELSMSSNKMLKIKG